VTSAATRSQAVPAQKVQDILRKLESSMDPDEHAVLQAMFESYLHMMVALSEKTATLARLRRLFGLETSERLEPASSEQAPDNDGSGSAPAEPPKDEAQPPEDDASKGDEPKPKKKRPNHGRRAAGDVVADNTDVKHPELGPGQTCPECEEGTLYLLRKKAPVLQFVGQPVIRAKSWTAETLRCSRCEVCFSPDLPEEARGPKYRHSAVVMIAYLHYVLGMPLDRFAQWQADLGVPVPASIQWSLLDAAGVKIDCIFDRLKATAAQASLLHLDDTNMRILELVGKRRPAAIEAKLIKDPRRTGIYTTGVLALGGTSPPVALFFTGVKHAGENLAALLDLRPPGLDKPVVMTDALNRNVPACIADRVIEANCMSHGRRGVFDQFESFPGEVRHVLEELAKVFVLDAVAKKDKLTPEQRLELHQRNSGAILGRLRRWIRTKLYREKTIEPNSELGRALKYIPKHWAKLTLFLRRPGVPLTNNICERLLKVAIRYRKNSSFYRALRGAKVGDHFMSLFQTAKLNGVDPMAYLQALLDNADQVAEAPERWLPWNYTAALTDAAAIQPTTPPVLDLAG